jgi:hypothetical protein
MQEGNWNLTNEVVEEVTNDKDVAPDNVLQEI